MLPSPTSKNPECPFLVELATVPLRPSIDTSVVCRKVNAPSVLPKSERNRHRIDVVLVPPGALVTLTVELAVMDAAQRHRELIRYPAAECARLRKSNMVSLARLPATQGCTVDEL